MQNVSKEYKESMKAPLRERGYIKVFLGIVNQEAQANATIGDGDYTYYSQKDKITDDEYVGDYATLENNFTRVDGSMFFLPRVDSGKEYFDTGLVSNGFVSDGNIELTINLNIMPTDFKGLYIDFGDNYPVDFDVTSNTGQVVSIRGNNKSEWTIEEVFYNTDKLQFSFFRMKNDNNRLRIHSIRFGLGLHYENDSIMDSTLESYVSPISADLPQIDFTVKIKNYNKYFDLDNPESTIYFFETGQELDVKYGYKLPNSDKIEWVQGNYLLCAEWESDDKVATIRYQDVLRDKNQEYTLGRYVPEKVSYYALAMEVFKEAGIKRYIIDSSLKNLYTTNPIPKVSHKEALQIIANACRCVLTQNRFGYVEIKPQITTVADDFEMSKNDMTSSPKVIKQERIKDIIVPCYLYQQDPQEVVIVSDEVNVTVGSVETYYTSTAGYGYKALLDDVEGNVDIVNSGAYFITLRYNVTGSFNLSVVGHNYNIIEKNVTKSLHTVGKTIKWSNPLISDMQMAQDLCNWLAEYYSSSVEYDYSTRGNPELDAADIIYQENDFRENMKVNVYKHTISFKQSFSGKVTARRIGE